MIIAVISSSQWAGLVSAFVLATYLLGIANAAHAVMNVRSSRGAIAWGISLITFPWLAIPLYWILGRSKFRGYAETLQVAYLEHAALAQAAYGELQAFLAPLPPPLKPLAQLAKPLALIPFTHSNRAKLLIDGQQTYTAMLAAIASAKDYILLQTYILHDDVIGRQFRQALITQAQQGVRVYLLYDRLGSQTLARRYLAPLRKHGVEVSSFRSSLGWQSRFQLNFRNHRKILVVDGQIGFVGGLNIGDEYLGQHPRLSPWRDTHIQVQGPAVQSLQMTFFADWYWDNRELLQMNWQPVDHPGTNQIALVLPTGPADQLPGCILFFVNLINQAQHRLWIATPYFVPDESLLTALQLAALRGVDVRILLPDRPDHLMVYYCGFSFYQEMLSVGVKLYRYQAGFMHQKVILCDRLLAGVGTVNLDNRSFNLNFEVSLFVASDVFIAELEAMLVKDFQVSRLVKFEDYQQRPLWFKLWVRIFRLLTPIL
jgi:cardiolipin synthase A/B